MAILELQFPQRPRKRTKTHQGELSNAVFDTAWNDLLDVWAWKPEAQARNTFHAFFMQSNGIAAHRKYDQSRIEGTGQNYHMVCPGYTYHPNQCVQNLEQREH